MKKQELVENQTIKPERNKVGINFVRNIVDKDLQDNVFKDRRWKGIPAPDNEIQQNDPLDPAKVRTRFPPEPNGYLHLGHAKSICLNFGIAEDYDGSCHLRFDDTNPTSENTEFVNSIVESVKWLGFDWKKQLFYASDYFEYLFSFAVHFIQNGLSLIHI